MLRVTSASPERTAQRLPTPKFTQDMWVNLTRVHARQGPSLGLFVENGVRCFTVTLSF